MTYGDIIDQQRKWSKNHGSSAAGAYQFMRAMLIDLATANPLISGTDLFKPELQVSLDISCAAATTFSFPGRSIAPSSASAWRRNGPVSRSSLPSRAHRVI